MILNKIVNFKNVLVLLACLGNVQSMEARINNGVEKELNEVSLFTTVQTEEKVPLQETINNNEDNKILEKNNQLALIIKIIKDVDELKNSNKKLEALVGDLVRQNEILVQQNEILVEQNKKVIHNLSDIKAFLKSSNKTNNEDHWMIKRMYFDSGIEEDECVGMNVKPKKTVSKLK